MQSYELDKEKYVQTIKLCELTNDLKILGAGDLTEIGEKGINLSGGQKARVSLARAVYADREIYLMDDPISALDASVRQKIIENVIFGKLKEKTRILVTHAIDFLHMADKIFIMEKGRIVSQGGYKELMAAEDATLANLVKINKLNNDNIVKSKDEAVEVVEEGNQSPSTKSTSSTASAKFQDIA